MGHTQVRVSGTLAMALGQIRSSVAISDLEQLHKERAFDYAFDRVHARIGG
jgi:hypothetical protein